MTEEMKKLFREQKIKGLVEILRSFGIKAERTDDEDVIRIDLNENRYAKLRLLEGTWTLWKVISGPEMGITMDEESVLEYTKNRAKPGTYLEDPMGMTFHIVPGNYTIKITKLDDLTYATSGNVDATRFDKMVVYEDGYIELEMCGHIVKQMWAHRMYPLVGTATDMKPSSYFKDWAGM